MLLLRRSLFRAVREDIVAQPKHKDPSRPTSEPRTAEPEQDISARGGDLSRGRDPGDAVPPGVAPAQPAPPPRPEDLKVRAAMERRLGKRGRS